MHRLKIPKSLAQRTFKQSLCSAIGLFLTEQRAIREELENRCRTPEITCTDDDPNRPADDPPTVLPTSRDLLAYAHKPTVLCPSNSLGTASSSLYSAANYYSTPSTRPALPCVTLAHLAFKRSRQVSDSRTRWLIYFLVGGSFILCCYSAQHWEMSCKLILTHFWVVHNKKPWYMIKKTP